MHICILIASSTWRSPFAYLMNRPSIPPIKSSPAATARAVLHLHMPLASTIVYNWIICIHINRWGCVCVCVAHTGACCDIICNNHQQNSNSSNKSWHNQKCIRMLMSFIICGQLFLMPLAIGQCQINSHRQLTISDHMACRVVHLALWTLDGRSFGNNLANISHRHGLRGVARALKLRNWNARKLFIWN